MNKRYKEGRGCKNGKKILARKLKRESRKMREGENELREREERGNTE